MRVTHVIRWALVPIVAAVAWTASIVAGVILHDAATRLCPESQMVSGACVAPWWPIADAVVIAVSAALAAASIVLGCSFTAPTHRARVAVIVYVIGAIWAVVLAIGGAAYTAVPAAGLAGGWAVWWIRKRASGLGAARRL